MHSPGTGPLLATSRSPPHHHFNMENMTEARWSTEHMESRNPTDCRRARACGFPVSPFLYGWVCVFVCVPVCARTCVHLCDYLCGCMNKGQNIWTWCKKNSVQGPLGNPGTISSSGRDKITAWLKETRRQHKCVRLQQITMKRKGHCWTKKEYVSSSVKQHCEHIAVYTQHNPNLSWGSQRLYKGPQRAQGPSGPSGLWRHLHVSLAFSSRPSPRLLNPWWEGRVRQQTRWEEEGDGKQWWR